MGPPVPPPAGFDALFAGAAILYALYLLADLVGLRALWRGAVLGLGVATHLVGVTLRGVEIGWFPLTNKFESFYTFSLSVMMVTLLAQRSPSRLHRLFTFVVGAVFYAVTLKFDNGTFFPPPLMQTIWYPLHVPASFLAYALWVSAAGAGLAVLFGRRDVGRTVTSHCFWGWCVFSVSMVFGGAWGWVAWGAYFLWDPKVVWSVILWLYYSGFVHLEYWPPGKRPAVKAVVAVGGVLVMLVAYVGTSFFFVGGSHSFG